jgi:Uncharacterized protein conserved in bacteria
VEYESSPTGKLASDIVIKGRESIDRDTESRAVPLTLDVDVDLGRDLTFVGEGLDAKLAGRVPSRRRRTGACRDAARSAP